jgi:hypothetical protein
MKLLILFTILFANTVIAQDNRIAQFAIWKPLPGQELAFQNGYKRHLQWHKTAGDTWEWYGWYFASGPRVGQFVDATFDHFWSDFDKPVNPDEDRADNQINVYPYADLQSVFKVTLLKEQSIFNPASLKSKRLRLLTIKVGDIPSGVKILDRLRAAYRNNPDVTTYMVFKSVDGGDVNELMLIIGFDSWEYFGKTENIQDQMAAIETGLNLKTILSITSETLVYRADLSLFGE